MNTDDVLGRTSAAMGVCGHLEADSDAREGEVKGKGKREGRKGKGILVTPQAPDSETRKAAILVVGSQSIRCALSAFPATLLP